jgi:hypothetical protein
MGPSDFPAALFCISLFLCFYSVRDTKKPAFSAVSAQREFFYQ